MFSDTIAQQLRAKGHDIIAVVADPALVSLPDDQILAHAAAAGRALVTANIKDFMPLDGQYRAAGQVLAQSADKMAVVFPPGQLPDCVVLRDGATFGDTLRGRRGDRQRQVKRLSCVCAS